MRKRLLLLLPLCLLWNCVSIAQTAGVLNLTGRTSGIKDGTTLYFRDLLTGETIDSTKVTNDEFFINKKMPEPAVWVMLHTKDRSKFRSIWLENKEMTFNSRDTSFRDAKITGSRTQEIEDKFAQLDTSLPPAELKEKQILFVKKHPESIFSMKILDMYGNKWGASETGELYNLLSSEVQNTSFGRRVRNFIETDSSPRIGDKFIDFTLPDNLGNVQRFSELTGKYTLLHFWASTCPPSHNRNEKLKDIYNKYHQDGFEIVGISLDTQNKTWKGYIIKHNIDWINLSGLKSWDGKVAIKYGINSTPDNFLVDEEGTVVARDISPKKLASILKNSNE